MIRTLSLPWSAVPSPEPVTPPMPVVKEADMKDEDRVPLTPEDELFVREYLAGGADDMGSWDIPPIMTLWFRED